MIRRSVFLEPRVGAGTGGPCQVRPWRAWNALLRNLGACSADLIFHRLRNVNESPSLILDTWMFIQTLAHSHLLTNTCIHMYPVRARYLAFIFPMLDYIVWRQGKGRQTCWMLCFSRHVIQHRQSQNQDNPQGGESIPCIVVGISRTHIWANLRPQRNQTDLANN